MPVQLEDRCRAGVAAVRAAARVCRSVQQRMISPETIQKKDKSPVTVADFASQAVVCSTLAKLLPDDAIVAEEDAAALRADDQSPVLKVVREQVEAVGDQCVDDETVLSWIDLGSADADPAASYWTLDPIDGTKGFLRKEQYAIALAYIVKGRVMAGVLGCPNLPTDGGTGALLVAIRGGGAKLLPLWDDAAMAGKPARVSAINDPAAARFCESVESGHSDQDQSVQIARLLGITADAVRMDSQAKYATLARGEAQIYLRLPTRADYRECIWDHAAGCIVVEEAGGRVTDVTGAPLDFAQGRKLERNKGVVATCGSIHDRVVAATRQTLGI